MRGQFSVGMQVVRIRHVGMGMPRGCVVVPVAVCTGWHLDMGVQVMAVVMVMGMLVLQRVMVVQMGV